MIIEPFKISQPAETSEVKWFSEQYVRQKLELRTRYQYCRNY